MNKKFTAGITLFAFLSLGLPTLALSEHAGQIEGKSGRVLVKTEKGWNPVGNNAVVEPGSLLRTVKGAEVTVGFPGDSRVRISGSSEIRVVSIDENGASLVLERGKVLGRVGDHLQVGTLRTNTVATEGEFVLATTPTGTKLDVLSGNATLSSDEDVDINALETLPEGVDTDALATLDDLGSEQSVGVVAMSDTEEDGNGQEEEEDDDDDNTAWALGGAGALIVAGVIIAMGGEGDDEVVGQPSPTNP